METLFFKTSGRRRVGMGALFIIVTALLSGCQTGSQPAQHDKPQSSGGGPIDPPRPPEPAPSGPEAGGGFPLPPDVEIEAETEAGVPGLRGSLSGTGRNGFSITDISAGELEAAGMAEGDILDCAAGPLRVQAPLVPPDSREPLPRFTLLNGFLVLYHTGGIPDRAAILLTTARKEGYRGELELRKLKRSEALRDYSSDRAFANFREIRRGAIAPRTLYRSSHPALQTPRAPYAARLAEQARPRIETVLNLSNTWEELEDLASYIPWYENFIRNEGIIALAMPQDYSGADFRGKLKRALEFMAERRGPYLLHSEEGINRTGYTAALLEALMGASYDEIIEDYMLSYVNYYNIVPGEEPYRAISRIGADMLAGMGRSHPPQPHADGEAMRLIAEDYLLNAAGLSQRTITALKERLAGRAE